MVKDITIKKQIVIESLMEYGSYFEPIRPTFQQNPLIFKQVISSISSLVVDNDGQPHFDANFNNAITIIDSLLLPNIHVVFNMIHNDMKFGRNPTCNSLKDKDLQEEIMHFAKTIGPIIDNSLSIKKQKDRQAIIVLKAFKEVVLNKPLKKALILLDWLNKWSSYLQQEETFSPKNLKAYKQGEFILVDFGFNIGGEFGGRHYAVVIERNNNPSSGVILIAPISSYDPAKGQTSHPVNVDLGVGAINGYGKGSQVVMNQIRYISKIRIEKPKTSNEPKLYIKRDKLIEVIEKFKKRVTP